MKKLLKPFPPTLMSDVMPRSCSSISEIKPFEQMPGPKPVPLLGNVWRYFPIIGEYTMERLHTTNHMKYAKFGKIVREPVIGKTTIVHLFDPEDIEAMFRREGRSPVRISHRALQKYRQDRPHQYNNGGILPTNGTEWNHLRTALQKPLSRPAIVKTYIPLLQTVTDDFIERTKFLITPSGLLNNYLEELKKWALETVGLIALDTRFGCLDYGNWNGRSQKIMKASYQTLETVMKTENGIPWWQMFETRSYKKLIRAQDYLYQIARQAVENKKRTFTEKKDPDANRTVLETYLSTPELDEKDIITAATDLLFAGIDTTSHAVGFTLFHLATNPEVQQLLHKEIVTNMTPGSNDVTADILAKMSYLKACVKESFRLHPISIGTGRVLPTDIILSGYRVPAGTIMLTQNQVACRLPHYFKDPETYRPARWMKKEMTEKTHPFLLLPFGYGPRSCIARRLAEVEIYIFLMKFIQNFQISWLGQVPLDCYSALINVPDQPLNFKVFVR